MSKSLNVYTCEGRLCGDPRINDLQSGSRVANLRLAVNYSIKEDGEWAEHALFFDVEIWNGVDAIEQYFHKGDGIAVFGTLAEREWTDANTGEKRKTLCIKNAQWSFPAGKASGDGGQAQPAQQRQAAPAAAPQGGFGENDIPF